MGEQTPERLQEFRARYAETPRRRPWLAVLNLAVLITGFAAVIALTLSGGGPVEAPTVAPGGGLTAEKARALAVYLAERHQAGAAIEAYEDYLAKTALDPEARAKACYSVAKLAIEAERYEDALRFLYEAEFLAPESELKPEIDQRVVLCLEKLDRPADLRKELRKRTRVKRSADDVGEDEVVLAELAGEVITQRDLEHEIAALPAYVRDSVSTPEEKIAFLKNMLAQRLLVDKARRLELDKDPEIQTQLAEQLDAMMVQRLIEDEVARRVHITPEDVERFYKASPEQFTTPAQARVRVGRGETAEAVEALESFDGEPVMVRAGGAAPGLPDQPEAVEAILAAEPGARVGPYEGAEGWVAFEVVEKQAARLKPFEEVRDQARRMYEGQKRQEQVNALIDETLDARDVVWHPERLKQEQGAS